MRFLLENGEVFSTLRILFERGETFKAQAGAMVSMSPSIELQAKSTAKGFFGAMKAAVGGESLFASIYTAHDNGELVLAPSTPGAITQIHMEGNTIYAQSGAYLAGSPELELSTKGSLKALVSGEDLFLQKITGRGVVFLESFGAIIQRTLAPGEPYIVDTGHIVAFDDSVTYTMKRASKGLMSSALSGEGFVCEYRGPGRIWIQTRNVRNFVEAISKFLPSSHD